MKKVVICPDSFKGSLSSSECSLILETAVHSVYSGVKCVRIPLADGGEGSCEALGAEKILCRATDANFNEITAFWGLLDDKAVIELAAVCGLPQTKMKNPGITTTLGVGDLIRDALNHGIRDFILALGGSSTNDFGCGMAASLGVRFFDSDGCAFVPTGNTLSKVCRVDRSEIDPRIFESRFVTMCDVNNPLCGTNGAAYVFAPQKGALAEDLPDLDQGLAHIAKLVEKTFSIDVLNLEGGGAAGGCAAGTVAFLSSQLKSGIDTVLEFTGFYREIADADLVITGEGRFDSQSLGGKAVSGVAAAAGERNVPCIVFCGSADRSESVSGVNGVFPIVSGPVSLEKAMDDAKENLLNTAIQVLRFAQSIENHKQT